MKPKRIQRKRTRGWKMPPNTVYVGRPTVFGNLFGRLYGRRRCVSMYRNMLRARWCRIFPTTRMTAAMRVILRITRKQILQQIDQLRGKNVCCWCKLSDPCHADVLLELANE